MPRHVDLRSPLAAVGRGRARDLAVGERPRHAGRELVELALRFDEDIVAHLDRGGDLAGADQPVARSRRWRRRSMDVAVIVPTPRCAGSVE